jgi:hypothetical protein
MDYLKMLNPVEFIRACCELIVTLQHNPQGSWQFIFLCGMLFLGWMWIHR